MASDSQAVQWRLRGASFLSSFDRFVIPPLLVPISHAFGVPLGTAALVASAYFVAYGLSQPFWGAVSDRFGRAKLSAGLNGLGTLALLKGTFNRIDRFHYSRS